MKSYSRKKQSWTFLQSVSNYFDRYIVSVVCEADHQGVAVKLRWYTQVTFNIEIVIY